MTQWLAGCNQALPDGRPGCVLVRGKFKGSGDQVQAMVLYLVGPDTARASYIQLGAAGDVDVKDVYDPDSGRWTNLPAAAVARALDGDFDIRPSGTNALYIGSAVLVPGN